MIVYEVTLEVESALAREVEEYMLRIHIPEIFATGCFRRIRFYQASPGHFRTCYETTNPADLERYLRSHAPHFRAEFHAVFPSGISVSRTTWTERVVWE